MRSLMVVVKVGCLVEYHLLVALGGRVFWLIICFWLNAIQHENGMIFVKIWMIFLNGFC